jgi:hypothetical protein
MLCCVDASVCAVTFTHAVLWPGLVVDWTGEGLQVWQQRFAAASGATTVNQLLRKHGIKVGLCWTAVYRGVSGVQWEGRSGDMKHVSRRACSLTPAHLPTTVDMNLPAVDRIAHMQKQATKPCVTTCLHTPGAPGACAGS